MISKNPGDIQDFLRPDLSLRYRMAKHPYQCQRCKPAFI